VAISKRRADCAPPLIADVRSHAMNAAAKLPPTESSDRDELMLLYQVSVADIAFFKQQQWSVTNYAIGIHAALLFIAYQLAPQPLQTLVAWILIVLAWSAVAAGFWLVGRLQDSILGRRTRLKRIRERFGDAFNCAWEIPKPADDVYQLLHFVVFASASVITWLVLVRA
jgi:hypothetical protein